jgi:hypothetical protein
MMLRPDNMGAVAIKLDSHDRNITGKIEVTSAEVRNILKANVAELRVTLANMGLNVEKFEISLMNYNLNSAFDGDSHNEYAEWEGGVLRNDAEEALDNAGFMAGPNNYLNYLA